MSERGRASGCGSTRPPSLPDPRRCRFRLRLSLACTRTALNTAVRRALQLARAAGRRPGELADLEIALREALANAMIHGNGSDRAKRVALRCYADPELGMLVAVRDEGPGFDPDTVPDPRAGDRMQLHHGRGLFLMRSLMDQVVYRKGGREVVLFKAWVRGRRG